MVPRACGHFPGQFHSQKHMIVFRKPGSPAAGIKLKHPRRAPAELESRRIVHRRLRCASRMRMALMLYGAYFIFKTVCRCGILLYSSSHHRTRCPSPNVYLIRTRTQTYTPTCSAYSRHDERECAYIHVGYAMQLQLTENAHTHTHIISSCAMPASASSSARAASVVLTRNPRAVCDGGDFCARVHSGHVCVFICLV